MTLASKSQLTALTVMVALLAAACSAVELGTDSIDLSPRFSPDGSSVVFTSDREDSSSLYVVEIDGGRTTRITHTDALDLDPTWLPDGLGIVYVQRADLEPTTIAALMAIDLEGEEISVVSSRSYEAFPDVSRDGLIVQACSAATGFTLCARSLDMLTAEVLFEEPSRDWQPVWSPDGAEIVYTSDASGSDDIWILDFETGERRQVTDLPSKESDPTWSPDGSQIAFTTDTGGELEIWTMSVDGSNTAKLTLGSKPHWSPDGAWVVFQGAPNLPDSGVSINIVKVSDGVVEILSR